MTQTVSTACPRPLRDEARIALRHGAGALRQRASLLRRSAVEFTDGRAITVAAISAERSAEVLEQLADERQR